MRWQKSPVDERLIEGARKIGRHRTNPEAVTAALKEYIHLREQLDVLLLFGTIDYDEDYNYKRCR